MPGKPLGQPPIQECVARYSSSDENHLEVPSSGSSLYPHGDPSWDKPESAPRAFLPSCFPSGPITPWWWKGEPDKGHTGVPGQVNGKPVQTAGINISK